MLGALSEWFGYLPGVDNCLTALELFKPPHRPASMNDSHVVQLVLKIAKLLEQQEVKAVSGTQIARFVEIQECLGIS